MFKFKHCNWLYQHCNLHEKQKMFLKKTINLQNETNKKARVFAVYKYNISNRKEDSYS
jgi:hypothetical protein